VNAMDQVIVLMKSVHQHMAMEDRLDRHQIRYKTVVKPRSLGSDCGTALQVAPADIERIRKLSDDSGLTIFGVFVRENDGWKPMVP